MPILRSMAKVIGVRLSGGMLLVWATAAMAGDVNVVSALARRGGVGSFDIDVTVQSADTGWDRYADRIEVLGPEGAILGARVLEHPHDDEQPFTRTGSGVRVPPGIGTVSVRAHFKPTGFGGTTATVTLPTR
ncbi:hypothetical protein [Methylobacterium sp. V23]|uniref:hypothetical protein n=1 Tax=Methylobacterium sp. V23 TaxID=2044878 RepID=UPI001AECA17C|nr:hypothetical protein [Methylobacterium sp. V23]